MCGVLAEMATRALRSRRENALTEPEACQSPSKAFTKAVSKSVKALVQSVRALSLMKARAGV